MVFYFTLWQLDSLLTHIPELITGSKTEDVGVKNAMMKALQEVVGKAGGNMSEASKNSILNLIDDDTSDQNGKSIPGYAYNQVNATLLTLEQMPWLSQTPNCLVRLSRFSLLLLLLRSSSKFIVHFDLSIFEVVADFFSLGRNRVLSPQSTHVSVLGLNALLVESPKTLTEGFGTETHTAICQGVSNKDVSFHTYIIAMAYRVNGHC